MSQPPQSPARLLHIDGLRGIALVLIHHLVTPLLPSVPGAVSGYALAALTLGYTGVDLFFVLSGYLIGGILLDHRESPRLFRVFYLRRACRILPIATVLILLVFIALRAGLYEAPETTPAPWPMPAYLLFTTNLWMAAAGQWGFLPLAHLWSLAIEEQFYLAAPALVWIAKTKWLPLVLGGVVVFALSFRLGVLLSGPERSLVAAMLPFGRMDGIGLGMLVAWLLRRPESRARCAHHRPVLLASLIIGAAGCALLTRMHAINGGPEMAAWGYTWVSLWFATFVLYLETNPGSRFRTLLSLRPIVALGRYSYFIYLFQFLVPGLAVGLFFHHRAAIVPLSSWVELTAGLAVLLLAAMASWRWIESPLIARGRRQAY